MSVRSLAITLVAVISALGAGPYVSMTAAVQQSKLCSGPFVFEGQLSIPPGMGVRSITRIDSNCRVLHEPIEVLTPDQVRFLLGIPRTQRNLLGDHLVGPGASVPRVPGLAAPSALVPGGPLHIFIRVKDGAGLNLTSIDPHNLSYGYNGSTITSYSHDAWIWRAVDQQPTCGPGWSVEWSKTGISISGGGVGSSFIDSLTHAEFSYIGRFDCSGTQFYNILDTKLTGFGNGSPSTGAYRTTYRNVPPLGGWYEERLAWDAYNWMIPPRF
jgi:hypothetical protein